MKGAPGDMVGRSCMSGPIRPATFCASEPIKVIKKKNVYFILFIEIIRELSANPNVIFLSSVVNILEKTSSQVNHS
jgi:hypothetical protein